MSEQRSADISSSQRFESGWNRLQLAVEAMVGLTVLGGLAAILGNGPLSQRTTSFEGVPLTTSYEAILRRTVPARVELRITAPWPRSEIEVELPNQLATDMDVVSAAPRPTRVRAERDGAVYT